MKIINMIYIGNETYNIKNLSKEKKEEIALQLNKQALIAIGYRPKKPIP